MSTIERRSLTIAMSTTLSRQKWLANALQYLVLRTLQILFNINLYGNFVTTGNKSRVLKEKALEFVLLKVRYCPLLSKEM
jgi:hypothetical protein